MFSTKSSHFWSKTSFKIQQGSSDDDDNNNSKIKVQLLYPKADFNDARYPLYTKYVVPEGTDRGNQHINVNLREGNCRPKGKAARLNPS